MEVEITRDWDGYAIIPREQWGHDHRTTLMYVESRAVDHSGVLRNANMRTGNHHIQLLDPGFTGHMASDEYPTRLADGTLLRYHDDWDCLADLKAAGMVEVSIENTQKVIHGERIALWTKVVVKMTAAGFALSQSYRAEKAAAKAAIAA